MYSHGLSAPMGRIHYSSMGQSLQSDADVQKLINEVQSVDKQTRKNAADALIDIFLLDSFIEQLIVIAQDASKGPDIRSTVTEVLAEQSPKSVVGAQALMTAIRYGNKEVAEAAVNSLVALSETRMAKPIFQTLRYLSQHSEKCPPEVRLVIADALAVEIEHPYNDGDGYSTEQIEQFNDENNALISKLEDQIKAENKGGEFKAMRFIA